MSQTQEEILKEYVNTVSDIEAANPSGQIHIEDEINPLETTGDMINRINAKLLEQNEMQKFRLREKLTKKIGRLITIQLIFFNLVIFMIVAAVTIKIPFVKEINNDLAELLFEFLKYYIGATVVELLGMLGFILHYVFSHTKKIK